MRGLIVGFGNIAQGHLQGYSTITDLEPVAVVDVTAARREVALRHGLLAFGSIAEAINSTDIDFVDICTHVRKIRQPKPVTEYLRLQRRFAHLFKGGVTDPRVARIQAIADRHIAEFGLTEAVAQATTEAAS